MEQLSNKNPRIEVVDALRGFAVMAILWFTVLNISFSRLSHRFTNLAKHIGSGSIKRCFHPICRKSYAIFALLFGFTFYIQSNNQKKQGKDFGYRFLWRLVLLAVFATLNAAFSLPEMYYCYL